MANDENDEWIFPVFGLDLRRLNNEDEEEEPIRGLESLSVEKLNAKYYPLQFRSSFGNSIPYIPYKPTSNHPYDVKLYNEMLYMYNTYQKDDESYLLFEKIRRRNWL